MIRCLRIGEQREGCQFGNGGVAGTASDGISWC